MKEYFGYRSGDDTSCPAHVYWGDSDGETRPLSPKASQKIWNHSPDGFNWGYGGSGPAQLALAILYHFTKSREVALHWYQDFKWAFVAGWGITWAIRGEEIQNWLARKEEEAKAYANLR